MQQPFNTKNVTNTLKRKGQKAKTKKQKQRSK